MTSLNVQKDLRRISLNRRVKTEAAKSTGERINSPLAKYDQQGTLHCIICKTTVKSSSIWKVHINTANHKRNVEAAKQHKKEILEAKPLADKPKTVKTVVAVETKTKIQEEKPTLVGNLKETESAKEEQALPENFFDVVKDSEKEKEAMDEEYSRFQREIKEQSIMSTAIEAYDHDHTAFDRQLEEIDEQILCWSKVKNLEEKKESIIQNRPPKRTLNEEADDNDSDDEDETNFDEFPNWRSKKIK